MRNVFIKHQQMADNFKFTQIKKKNIEKKTK